MKRLRTRARRHLALLTATLLSLPLTWAMGGPPDIAALLCVMSTGWAWRVWSIEDESWRWSLLEEAWRARAGLDALGVAACALTLTLAAATTAWGAGFASALAMFAALTRLVLTMAERRRIQHHTEFEDRTGAHLPWRALRVDGPWIEALVSGERLRVRQGPSMGTWGTWGIGAALLLGGAALAPWTMGRGLALWVPAIAALGWAWVRGNQERVWFGASRGEATEVKAQGQFREIAWGSVFEVREEEGRAVVRHEGEEVAAFLGDAAWLARELQDLRPIPGDVHIARASSLTGKKERSPR